jgi:hypothetical protein
MMTDHVCREMGVREEISRHETSAADARAMRPSQNMSAAQNNHTTFASESKSANFCQGT